MALDWSPLIQPLIVASGSTVTVVAGNLGYWMNRKLKLGRDTELNTRLAASCEAAAGLAYSLLSTGAPKSEAIAKAVQYVQEGMPAIIDELKVTAGRLSQMIEARLGKLLAIDPTTKIPLAVVK